VLNEYLEKAKRTVGGHEPHILEEAFSFHLRLQQTGSMK
jgi:acyl-CoA hydrolase